MIHIGSGIYRVAGHDLTSPYDDASYIATYDKCHVMIDAGSGGNINAMLTYIMYLVSDIREINYLIVTHAHHRNSGGAAYLREIIPTLSIIAHTPDSYYLRNPDKNYNRFVEELGEQRPVYVSIEISEEIRVVRVCDREEIKIIHTPCHTEGSISILIRRGDLRYAFVGGLLEENPMSSSSCEKSFEKILSEKPDVTCSSSGCIYGFDNLRNLLGE
ncbi:MAG: MBL fold metallo-hydrolase [Sulfolobales archaeon]